jgi:hypothetical protein
MPRADNDDALAVYDKKIAMQTFFKDGVGLSERAAERAAIAEAALFDFVGGRLTSRVQGADPNVPALQDKAAIAFYSEGGVGNIYKIEKSGATDDDTGEKKLTDDEATALMATVTGRGKLVKAIGQKAAAALVIKAGFKSLHDFKTPTPASTDDKPSKNPWRSDSWSITEQGRLVKSLGIEKAAAIAAAAGSRIGATKPSA